MKYDELVKALRCMELRLSCNECEYGVWSESGEAWGCEFERKNDDAAAAIEALQALLKEADKKQAYQHDYVCELVAEVEELKAQLPKQGEWIDDGTKYGIHWFKCSVCGESQDIPTVMLKPYYKYCPNCGAKMEVQDGTD